MNIIVTVDKKHLDDIAVIATRLENLGVSVQRIMKITGIITGSIKETKKDLSSLKIAGVKSVEKSRAVKG